MPPNIAGMDRRAVELNEDILTEQIRNLGTRVSVDTLEVHVKSLYDLMRMPVASLLPYMVERRNMQDNREREREREGEKEKERELRQSGFYTGMVSEETELVFQSHRWPA